jgi:hypothetical protein
MARVSSVLYFLLGLFVVVQAVILPAAPSGAQTCTPFVSFFPSSVAPGGTIDVSGSCHASSVQINVDLTTPAGVFVVNLGSLTTSELGDFEGVPFTIPTGTAPGTYRVRTSTDALQIAISDGALTVTGGPGTITGVARCNVPPLTLLPNATVNVFSGSALVFTTHAGSDGSYAITGTAQNATYVIRYVAASSAGIPACGVGVTTNSDGFATSADPSACPSPDLNNRTWLTPAVVPTSAAGATINDSICAAGQSRWFKVAIKPGQQVTAEVLDPSFDVTLAMFKDIRQVADEMNATAAQAGGLTLEDVRRFTASQPHDVAAPDISSPDISSPDISSPDISSPDISSPDISSPDISSPDISSPDISSPDISSPDISSPDISSPDAYSSAQSQSILAYSDKPGPSSEFVRRHTWDNTGFFYVRVRGHNGAFDETQPFTLRVTVVNRDCLNGEGGQFNVVSTPASLTGLPSGTPRTLILTNSARFPAGSDISGLLASLNTFARRPEIGGAVIDLASDAGLAADYAQWDSIPDCVPAANIVAEQIKRIITTVRAHDAGLAYLVFAGNDKVAPFFRLPDQAGLSNEHDYSPAVLDFSASQASLKTGYYLSQDSYGCFTRISLRDHITPCFDVPVGRLVENVSDIQTMLAAYSSIGGVITPSSALVTGYDFLADSATAERTDLTQSGLTVDALIQPEGDGAKAPTAWHADDLRARLFGAQRFGIMELNAHFSGNTMLAADFSTRLLSREIASVTDSRFRNSVVLSMGCHSGYNIVDPEATAGTQRNDWAQSFAMQGASVIGGSGYQYGNSPLIKYSEVLLSGVTRQLRYFDGAAPGPVTLGRAIVETKRDYVRGALNGIDEKSVAELTLYGLPMMALNLPAGRLPRPAPPAAVSPTPGVSSGLSFADLSPGYTLTGHDRVLQLVGGGTTTATFYDASYGSVAGDTSTTPGQPIGPRVLTSVQANNTVARGAVMISGNYTDVFSALGGANPFRPLIDMGLTDARGIRPPYAASVFTPTQLVSLNDQQGQVLVEKPFQFKSNNGTSVFGVGRRYDSISARVYYSNRLDAAALVGPPVVYRTVLTASGTQLLIDATVGGARSADIEEVFATFTANQTDTPNSIYGHWASIRLTPGTTTTNTTGLLRHYTGALETGDTNASPQDIRLFIQAVGGNGLVSTVTNNGSFYRLDTQTATLGSPKLSTNLAFQQPTGTPYNATYRVPLHVSARLTNRVLGTPIAGKPLTFVLGTQGATTTTDANGVAVADIPVLVVPDNPLPQVTVDFAEDAGFLGSSDRRGVSIARAPTAFLTNAPAPIPYGGAAVIATLVTTLPSGNKPLTEVGVRLTLPDGRVLDTQTDGFGQVLFDTTDFEGVQPGSYSVVLSFAGNERYLPTSTTITETVVGSGNRSLAINGAGFAEAPHSADLNLTGDWTVELWFKDENPNGFNHDYVTLINKGDRATNGESPYIISLGFKQLLVGQRTGFVDYTLNYDLFSAGVDPKAWHHVAATFSASTRTLILYFDGVQVKQDVLAASSVGNTLPVELGRNGAVAGKNLSGKLDDVRLWNLVRTASQIAGSFHNELPSPPAGLVANWQFNERIGTLLAFSTTGNHTAVLSTSGAAFSNDHP